MREALKRRPVAEPLEGRVALVTGGGTGVGANIARGLADAGMDVWVTGRTEARIKAVAAQIDGTLAGDVSKEDDVARWFEQAPPVDLLVNNAGVQGPLTTFDEEEPGRGGSSTPTRSQARARVQPARDVGARPPRPSPPPDAGGTREVPDVSDRPVNHRQ